MDAMASQITSLTIVYSTVYSRWRSKKTSKLRVPGLCVGNSLVTGDFPAQKASNAKNVYIWWRHHAQWNYCSLALSHRYAIISDGNSRSKSSMWIWINVNEVTIYSLILVTNESIIYVLNSFEKTVEYIYIFCHFLALSTCPPEGLAAREVAVFVTRALRPRFMTDNSFYFTKPSNA